MTAGMTEAANPELDLLSRQIELRIGLVFHPHQVANLADTALAAAERFGYADTNELARALPGLADGAPELEYLISRLTVGESFFFRDAAQMNWLRLQYLPALIEQRRSEGRRTLRVWSAAAASGQELYSIAMLLVELLPDIGQWQLHLIGTDLNARSLQSAVEGHYQEWSMRAVDRLTRDRHFEEVPGGGARVKPELRRMVRFLPLNLAGDGFPSVEDGLHDFDLVLCRNVFIYFEQQRVREVLARVARCMAPDGVLMLGASDVVDAHIAGFETVQTEGMCYYRRSDGGAPVMRPWAPLPSVLTVAPVSASSAAIVPPPDVPTAAELRAQLDEALAQSRWTEAVRLVASLDAYELRGDALRCRRIASAFGNLGRLEEALQWCARAVELDPTDSATHFLQAVLQVEAGNDEAALEAFRRTLFLAPHDLAAQHQMALLYLRLGQREQGLRRLRNVLDLARQAQAGGDDSAEAGRLIDIIRDELLIHGEDQDPGR